jgi:complex III assembly factor LYRM7
MPTLHSARAEARRNFESNRNLRIGSEDLEKSLVHAEEVSKFLRENVVQGQAQDAEGNYSMLEHV